MRRLLPTALIGLAALLGGPATALAAPAPGPTSTPAPAPGPGATSAAAPPADLAPPAGLPALPAPGLPISGPPIPPFGQNDAGGFRNILPPGENGLDNGFDLTRFETTGQRPPHSSDQLRMYGDLVYASPGLRPGDIGRYFKDATFGVRPGDRERTETPRSDVTIVRDRGFGVPHIYGRDRAGAMFGAGYVAAEDRLFFIDVLRHLGRAELSSFVGGSEGNRKMDREQWRLTPYTEADLQRQIDQMGALYGADGRQVQRDLRDYVDGINRYIAEAYVDPAKMPAEYAAIARPLLPWKGTDVVATAGLVGGIFGKGGGRELDSALILQAAQRRFGAGAGGRVWADFRSAEDPETPTTVHGRSFPYEVPPRRVAAGSRALPDPGSVKREPVTTSGEVPNPTGFAGLEGLLAFPSAESNALVVSGRESGSGHPLAVFGPQTGYFSPQILMEQDMHSPKGPGGPAIDARGAAFPGVNLYVQLGRGRDYAWSATSAGQDNIDTFAVDLCSPDGSRPSESSDHYRFRGRCLAMEKLERTNAWTPNAADQTPPGTETLRSLRTALGIVIARGTVHGTPVAYTSLRSTYRHEADPARAFSDFMDPNRIRSARDYQRAASKIGYTFNWLYADDRQIAYFNSGDNPVRASGVDPNFPVRGRFEWRGFRPRDNVAAYTPFAQHPQVVDQTYLTSWNNKPAPGYRAADDQFGYSSVYRSQPLDDRIRRGIAGGRKMTLAGLIDAMEGAATVDLRGDKVLPLALQVLGRPRDPALRRAVDQLAAWQRSGAHRLDRNRDGRYDAAGAIRIMDAWWPRLVRAEFEPALGRALFDRLKGMLEIDNDPNNGGAHLGSAYQDGWYGYASKDLRTILRRPVRGRYSRVYCGGGSLGRCRAALESSLRAALAVPAAKLYGGDPVCQKAGRDGDQFCFDSILQRPLGAITQPLIHWVNRPTFQQAVEVRGHRPRPGPARPRFTG